MTPTFARHAAALALSVAVAAAFSGVAQAQAGQDGTSRPCFIQQPHWNVGLDGPVPRC